MWDILLLDNSSSMLPNTTLVEKGYNNLVEEQINQGSTNKFTVITFNEEVEIIKDEKFPNVSKMEKGEYTTKKCTALLDAVGYSYELILNNPEYDIITLTIITDGLENSSKIYTVEKLNEKKESIDKHHNLKIVFIGADISCIKGNSIKNQMNQSIDCSGDILYAMREASRTMSSQRENTEYISDGIVTNEELNIEQNIENKPILKRQLTSVEPPILTRCEKLCKLN
tara:strand:- start:2375 stop:3055 length:681 start_codon:yes stop_codon:yes gene_type:complete